MSWGIEVQGTREKVKARVVELLDKAASAQTSPNEAADIRSAKERILSLVDAADLAIDAYGIDWNAVIVKASGSHSWSKEGLTSGSFSLSVQRTSIAI